MQRFVDDDRGYRHWLDDHPDGFVINTGRTPSAAYLMLHRAGCGTITGQPARGATFTGDYAKVCGGRDELEDFARGLGGRAQPCGLCLAPRGQPAPARPAGGKYGPLREHLSGAAGTRIRMTFAEVEDLIGRLPESAYRHRAWWGNNDGNVEARAWLDAGWRVESVNQAAGEVVFTRAADGRPRSAAHPAASHPGYVDPQVSTSLAARAETVGLDPGKLVTLIAELNDNYSRGNAYAAHALLRAILDHIPPLLGCADFKAAASSYPWSRTDHGYARRLLDFKLQADDALHRQISKRPGHLGIDDMPPKGLGKPDPPGMRTVKMTTQPGRPAAGHPSTHQRPQLTRQHRITHFAACAGVSAETLRMLLTGHCDQDSRSVGGMSGHSRCRTVMHKYAGQTAAYRGDWEACWTADIAEILLVTARLPA